MSATRDLIAAALTAADLMEGMIGESYRPVGQMLRELCARAMVQQAPDMAEVSIPDLEEEDLLAAYHAGEESGYRRGRKAALQPVSEAEVPMPQGYSERPSDYTGGIWIESQMRQYGDAREAAGYAAGVAAGGKNSADDCSTCHYAAPTRHEQCSGCEQNVTMFINYKRASWAALRGEVKS